MEAEPRAGLIGADLKRHALAEDVDGQLEILDGRLVDRGRLLLFLAACGIG